MLLAVEGEGGRGSSLSQKLDIRRLLIIRPLEENRLSARSYRIIHPAREIMYAHFAHKSPVIDALELQLRLVRLHSIERSRESLRLQLDCSRETHAHTRAASQARANGYCGPQGVDGSIEVGSGEGEVEVEEGLGCFGRLLVKGT